MTRLVTGDRGRGRFFKGDIFQFYTLRALSGAHYHAADVGEVLAVIRDIALETPESWHAAWLAMAGSIEARAESIRDPIARGRAFFRAYTYFRAAEALLPPGDTRRASTFGRGVEAFHTGLNTLGVRHQRLRVPYGGGRLNALYFPASTHAGNRPLIVAHGGFDAVLEELYFTVAAACQERGYPVLIFEGPGQGAALREQRVPLTPHWEKPTAAVLDAFLAKHPTGQQIVLLGVGLGGLLALRAAAYDARIDGVAALGAPYDCGEMIDAHLSRRVQGMKGDGWLARFVLAWRARRDPSFRHAAEMLTWATGAANPLDAAQRLRDFTLAPLAVQIRQPVLLVAGAEDMLVPLGQTRRLAAALSGASSVTLRPHDRASGGGEECRLSMLSLWQADVFDWLAEHF